MHAQWDKRKYVHVPQPGDFSQAEDEIILHALQRLSAALPERSEADLATRMVLIASGRTRKGIAA